MMPNFYPKEGPSAIAEPGTFGILQHDSLEVQQIGDDTAFFYIVEETEGFESGNAVVDDPVVPIKSTEVEEKEQLPHPSSSFMESTSTFEVEGSATVIIDEETPVFVNEELVEPTFESNKENNKEASQKQERKRKRHYLSLTERNTIKKLKIRSDHTVRETCIHQNCRNAIADERRVQINEEYWSQSSYEQQLYIYGLLDTMNAQRSIVGPSSRRTESVKYYLKDAAGQTQRVCKVFFLTTLGFNKKNDNIIKKSINSFKNKTTSTKDGRKGVSPPNKIDKEPIIKHIKSFNPSISHYRREHAPNRLYLPSDMSITQMYQNYISDKTPRAAGFCSYEVYRLQVEALNISFVKLGHEECEYCEHYGSHGHTKEDIVNINLTCPDCIKWKLHLENAINARIEYEKDASLPTNSDVAIYSADLQKVIMLPRCDMFKNVIFSKRLSVYNETFAPVGKKKECPVFPILWHEAISGRRQEEIISTFHKFLTSPQIRDKKSIIVWMDNCSSQNKNWAFMSFLVYAVNSSKNIIESIEIKYFETGHTFMSADSFHARVEAGMRQKPKIYDFHDFVEVVKNTGKNVLPLEMKLEDFFLWKSYVSQAKLNKMVGSSDERPYLHDMIRVKVMRKSLNLMYMTKYEGTSWKTLDFIQHRIVKKTKKIPSPQKLTKLKGIPYERKQSLINLITGPCSVIPKNRLPFWQGLQIDERKKSDSNGRYLSTSISDDEL